MKSIRSYCKPFFLFIIVTVFFSSCAVRRTADVIYNKEHNLHLDVYAAKKQAAPQPVFIFVHGGTWVHGKKSTYRYLGKRMAKKGIVTVVIDYRLSPAADYKGMTMDAAEALKWVHDSISRYGGDPNQMYVSGHSAGGQIAGLVATDDHYFDSLHMQNPLKGAIMIDAFGLDMYSFFNHANKPPELYFAVFTHNEDDWRKASPYYHLHAGMPRFLMFTGGSTVPVIKTNNQEFHTALKQYQPDAQLISVKRAHHLGMIFNFYNRHRKAYKQIIDFMNSK